MFLSHSVSICLKQFKKSSFEKGKNFIIQFYINFYRQLMIFVTTNVCTMLSKILYLCLFIILPVMFAESVGKNDFNILLYCKLDEHLSLNLNLNLIQNYSSKGITDIQSNLS